MSTTKSIRQPLFLYALVFTALFALGAITASSFAMVAATKRAHHRAAISTVSAIVANRTAEEVRHALRSPAIPRDIELAIVGENSDAFGLDLQRTRELAASHRDGELIAVRIKGDEELFLVARAGDAVPTTIALSEAGRLIPLMLIAAVLIASMLGFSIGRLLLPQLSSLAEIAQMAGRNSEQLVPSDAPNEVVEVARRFRQTVRELHLERDRIAAQKEELLRMQEGLVRASKLASVGRLAAGIAHEIGNPLAAVRGYLSLLKGGLSPEQEQDVLDRSLRELERIHDTIKKLLTYARKGEDAVEPAEPFSPQKVLDEALGLVRGHPALRVVRIDQPGADGGAIQAVGHPTRLNQVLVNLMLNAGQALEGRSDPEVTILLREAADAVEIVVSDNGPGIESDKLTLIFDPFFTTKAPGEGTGLGLAVSRALMEAMGGDLAVSSELGRGASFTVRLKPHRPAAGAEA